MGINIIIYMEVNLKYIRFCGGNCFKGIVCVKNYLNKQKYIVCLQIEKRICKYLFFFELNCRFNVIVIKILIEFLVEVEN